jgi:DNA-binding protein YbaB
MAFDKIKQLGELNKMRQQAKKLQKQLEQEEETYEDSGIKIKVNGAQQIVYFELDGDERRDIKDAINKVMKSVQKKAAKKMMEMGGGLSGMFGGN